jgi:2-keto-4-pentenoate hydratase/2-oxohepta-3-ene-1,7-dioic acid hydratase in catechol pathway
MNMKWVRFLLRGTPRYGWLDGERVIVCRGDPFAGAEPDGEETGLSEVRVLPPLVPGKFIGLWNNCRALAEKLGQTVPAEPLYFLKATSSLLGPGGIVRAPRGYDGRVAYEGELGIVIGRRCSAVGAAQAAGCILGYTCVNDVTALDILNRDPSFAQWTRAKSFDTFGVCGPVIAAGLDPLTLTVRTRVNGRERQNYPAADMIFAPAEIISRLSHDMTLEPGDLIACGTSLGVLPMKPGSTVEVEIEGIGVLQNRFESASVDEAL